MYPDLSQVSDMRQSVHVRPITFKTKIELSPEISDALLELQKNNFPLTSMRPFLNSHECHFSLVLPAVKLSLPLKVVFLRRYPRERPIVYITGSWRYHRLIRPHLNEVLYDAVFPWREQSRLSQLLLKLQAEFSREPPTEKGVLENGIGEIEGYLRRVEAWKNNPMSQPPAPPRLDLQQVLKTFELQESLAAECSSQEAAYQIKAQEYVEGVSRLRCITQRFSKGKILAELEKMLATQVGDPSSMSVDDLLKKYFETRKEYHKTKILKDLYVEKFS